MTIRCQSTSLYFLLTTICFSFPNNSLVLARFSFFRGLSTFSVSEVSEVADLLILAKLCTECCLSSCHAEGLLTEMDITFILHVRPLVCRHFILHVCNSIFLCSTSFPTTFEKSDPLWRHYNVTFFIRYCTCDLLLVVFIACASLLTFLIFISTLFRTLTWP